MDQAQKQAECLRICGPNVQSPFHRMAPEMCPFKRAEWLNPPIKRAEWLNPPKKQK